MSTEENTSLQADNTTSQADHTSPPKEGSSAQEEGAVLLERAEPMAILTLSRPSALNALTWTMYQHLEQHLESLAHDDAIRAIVLRGDGQRAFAAGTDIEQFVGFTAEDAIAYEQKMEAVIECLYTFPKPTIAAVQGYAVGAGIVLSSACDLRYATPASRFGVPIGRTLGNCLSIRNYRHLVDAFGAMRVKEMLFTGRLLSAADALQCGFLTAILEEDQLLPHVKEIAQQISVLAPLTIWAAKEAQRRISEAEPNIPFDDVVTRVYGSQDFAEGVQSYLEKRKPVWKGK
jgi:enoyl-CoA hydratase/carnithine racemase